VGPGQRQRAGRHPHQPPSEEEYAALVTRFWWNITYVAKCLHRDQLFFAKYLLDGGLHHTLLATTTTRD